MARELEELKRERETLKKYLDEWQRAQETARIKSRRTKRFLVTAVIALLVVSVGLLAVNFFPILLGPSIPPYGPIPDPDAADLFKTAEQYFNGIGVPKDYEQARIYYEQAAEKGSSDALNSLGWIYQEGFGVRPDYKKARQYYEEAVEKGGNVSALNALGFMYQNGMGVNVDYVLAREYYEQADADGNVFAPDNLGVLYEFGYGVEQDYKKALEYYQRAVSRGNWDAQDHADRVQAKLP